MNPIKKEIEQLEKQAKVASGWKKEDEWSYRIELPEKEIYGIKVKPWGKIRSTEQYKDLPKDTDAYGKPIDRPIEWLAQAELIIDHGLAYLSKQIKRQIRLRVRGETLASCKTPEEAKKAVEDTLNSLK